MRCALTNDLNTNERAEVENDHLQARIDRDAENILNSLEIVIVGYLVGSARKWQYEIRQGAKVVHAENGWGSAGEAAGDAESEAAAWSARQAERNAF